MKKKGVIKLIFSSDKTTLAVSSSNLQRFISKDNWKCLKKSLNYDKITVFNSEKNKGNMH